MPESGPSDLSMDTIKSEKVDQEVNCNLLNEVQCILSDLDLTSIRMQDFLVVIKSDFDFTISGEPYIAFMMVLNLKTGKYILRLWNQTIASGSALRKEELLEASRFLFCQGRLCFGYQITETSFPRKVASTCSRVLSKGVAPDVTACKDCSRLKNVYSVSDVEIKEEPNVNQEENNDLFHANASFSDYTDAGDFLEEDKNVAHDDEAREDSAARSLKDIQLNSQELTEIQPNEKPHIKGESSILKDKSAGEKHFTKKKARKRIGDGGTRLEITSSGSNHVTKKRKKKTNICPVCGKTYGTFSTYYEHLRMKHFYGRFKCTQCGDKNNLAADLVHHMKVQEHMQDPLVFCPSCHTKVHFDEIQPHYEGCVKQKKSQRTKRNNNKMKICPVCSQSFNRCTYFDHMKMEHFYGWWFKCTQCGDKTKLAADLVHHMKVQEHMQDPLVVCPSCQTQVHFDEIQPHYESCIKVNRGKICPECGKTTLSKHMARHMEIHMREKGLTDQEAKKPLYHYCDICGKRCTTKDNLTTHQKSVHSEGEVSCPVCGMEFDNISKMYKHKRKEHNPHLQCEHCEYTTPDRTHLQLHIRKHFDPTFKCSFCGKMLKTERNLKAHEREHTGETPFKCTVCGKGFKADSTLRTHRKHVHKMLTPGMKPIEKRVRK